MVFILIIMFINEIKVIECHEELLIELDYHNIKRLKIIYRTYKSECKRNVEIKTKYEIGNCIRSVR